MKKVKMIAYLDRSGEGGVLCKLKDARARLGTTAHTILARYYKGIASPGDNMVIEYEMDERKGCKDSSEPYENQKEV